MTTNDRFNELFHQFDLIAELIEANRYRLEQRIEAQPHIDRIYTELKCLNRAVKRLTNVMLLLVKNQTSSEEPAD